MKKLLIALPLALLAACASQPSTGPASETTNAAASAATADSSGWQALRAKYMDCVKEKADDNLSSKGQSKDVANAALAACQSDLNAMHDSFRSYLDGQMSSAHGKNSARQAAARVTADTRDKARNYLVRYVENQRYASRVN